MHFCLTNGHEIDHLIKVQKLPNSAKFTSILNPAVGAHIKDQFIIR